MIFRFIQRNCKQWSIEKMARVLEVSTSGFYAWKKKASTAKARMDQILIDEIKNIQDIHHNRYGGPRVYHELRNRGYRIGHNRVDRLMRENGLNCRLRKKFAITTNSKHQEPVAENILNRQFNVAIPNAVWVSDITYLPTSNGWLFLCVIIDLHERMVVGWSMRTDMTATLVIDAFLMAVMLRNPKGALLFHSDRGIQYCCIEFRNASQKAVPALVRSMSRKGNCWDNACSESFFKTLKRELEVLSEKESRENVRLAVFEYIEVYYNRMRIHSQNGFRPPAMVDQLGA